MGDRSEPGQEGACSYLRFFGIEPTPYPWKLEGPVLREKHVPESSGLCPDKHPVVQMWSTGLMG